MLYLSAAHNSLFNSACLAPVAFQTRTGQREQGLCLPCTGSQIRRFAAQPGQCGHHCMWEIFCHPCPSPVWLSRALHWRGCGDFSTGYGSRARTFTAVLHQHHVTTSHNFHTTYLPCSSPDKCFRGGKRKGKKKKRKGRGLGGWEQDILIDLTLNSTPCVESTKH